MVKDELTVPNDVIQRARSIIAAGEAGCILIKDGHITDMRKGEGSPP